jgi:ribonuclease VapC
VYALDASALLALQLREPGASFVRGVIDRPTWMSTVNCAEVITRLVRSGGIAAEAMARIKALPIVLSPFDEADALHSAALWPATRVYGLSLGDRACLSLAARRGLAVVTADRAWAELQIGVEVVVIR